MSTEAGTRESPADRPGNAWPWPLITVVIVLAVLMGLGAFDIVSHKLAILISLIVALLFFRQPIIILVAIATAFIHANFAYNSRVDYLIQDMWFTLDREVLLAIPMFILAGAVMARGSIARRLIDVMNAMVGWLPGGLAVGVVLACSTFAAISGSSIVTLVAVGSIAYPALTQAGYGKAFSIGLICAAGSLGVMIPPSIAMILFGIMTETSITKLFLSGVAPGLLLALMLAAYSITRNRRLPVPRFSLAKLARAGGKGIFALLLPVILLGGIYSGYFSPTEAAAISLAYALLVEALVYRELRLKEYYVVLIDTVKLLGKLLPLVAIASSLNTIMDYEGVTRDWVGFVTETFHDPVLLMLAANVLLLLVGAIMEVSSAMVVLAPLLTPAMTNANFDPVHFGVVMTANLEIGYLTPPVGLNLIVAMSVFAVDFMYVVKAVLPYVAIMLLWLAIVAAFPAVSQLFVR